jgi:hypothetical protein
MQYRDFSLLGWSDDRGPCKAYDCNDDGYLYTIGGWALLNDELMFREQMDLFLCRKHYAQLMQRSTCNIGCRVYL